MSLILHSTALHVAPHRTNSLNSKYKGVQKLRVNACCSGLKELEKVGERVSLYGDLETMGKLNALSSITKQSREEEEKRNYYVNKGYAIRVLREDFPALFYKEPNYEIYRDDIVFKDPLNTFAGIDNYKSIFWALRFHGRIFFRALWIDIVSVWQPVENMIMVRWTVHGIPRVPWESRGRFDGTSEYKLDKNGKIYEHRVHNIALSSPPKFRVVSVEELIQVFGAPSTPKPTCFEITSFSISSCIPMINMPDIKYRLVSMLSFGQCTEEEASER